MKSHVIVNKNENITITVRTCTVCNMLIKICIKDSTATWTSCITEVIAYAVMVITLHAKLSGIVYCNRPCLFVCLWVCVFLGLLPR